MMNNNELIKVVMNEFATHFVPDSECLYLRDSKEVSCSFKIDRLNVLGFDMSQESKLPDVILYSKGRDCLYFVESVVSDRAIDEVRFKELTALTEGVEKVKVFVTAFPNFQSFKDNVEKLSWDTVAWIAEAPGI